MQNFRIIRKIRAFKNVNFLLPPRELFLLGVETRFIVEMKCKRCYLIRTTTEISNGD